MGRIKHETLEAVKNIPLHDIVSPVVKLARSGRNWRGLSPFTNEKTPSFYVLTDKNYFKCFSSGMAGDGISFIRETERLNFVEAIETLAERFNIPIQYEEGTGPNREAQSLKRQLFEIHEYATDFYHRCFLAENENGEWIRNYWKNQRLFTNELAETFKIGLAPASGHGLNKWLLNKEFTPEALEASGLFYVNQRNRQNPERWINRFRGRLMIPIRQYQGQVVAFTARQLDITPEDDPARDAKYINSPETPIFVKGNLLFNMDRARDSAREEGRFLMVEGQLDALRCWDVGLKETVAPQGTAITDDQIRLMKRSASRIDALLDGDRAGLQAALRLLPIAFRNEMECRILVLPDGEDPDDLFAQKGMQAIEEIESLALDGMVFATRQLLPEDSSPQEKADALQSLFEIVAQCESAVAREGYLDQIITTGKLPAASLRQDFERFILRQKRQYRPPVAPKTPKKTANRRLTNAEADLLWLVLQSLNWASTLATVFDHEWIDSHSTEGKVLARILTEIEAGTWEGVQQIDSLLDSDAERAVVSNLYVEEREQYDPSELAVSGISSLAKRFFQREIQTIDQKIQANPESTETLKDLMNQRRDLNRQRHDFSVPEFELNR